MKNEYICIDCGKDITQKNKRCYSCANKYNHEKMPWIGFQKGNSCGDRFKKGQVATKGSYKKGHGFSFETLCKMRRAKIGKRISPATEFKPNPDTDRSKYRDKHHLGNPRYVAWRGKVFMRDNWICQICKQRGGKLHAHHKKSWVLFPKMRYWVINGMTLCINCHQEIHFQKLAVNE